MPLISAKSLLASCALLGLAVPSGASLAATSPDAPALQADMARAELQQRYDELRHAMEQRSAPGIEALLAPGFTSTELSGRTLDAKAMIAEVQDAPADPNRDTRTTIKALTLDGKEARVRQTMTASAQVRGHAMEMIALAEDTWIHGEDGWKLKTTTSQEMTVTQDGKVIRQARLDDAPEPLHDTPPPRAVAIAGPQMEGR
ncbi:nuclear transport factor 2 family protein [Novosphingobium profundi]|uniref:nuclear transport factor 2 family protein n=1 Tax=Novosphingobium profundi TaxID=1774954 RepID=UPI001CFCDC8F|nr:nuclear transport factor 2 family protein [Novosphingobium profundi]